MMCEYPYENYGFNYNNENRCSNKCNETQCNCNNNFPNESRYTIAEILRNIARYGGNTPVTVYLDGPSTVSAQSTVSNLNLRVAENALVSGTAEGKSIETQATIAPNAIKIKTSGTANVQGLQVSATTEPVNIPLSVQSVGTSNIDLSNVSANISIPSLKVKGVTADQTVNVPITQQCPIRIDTGRIDNVEIPSLEVCCKSCGHKGCGSENSYDCDCNHVYDGFCGNEGFTPYNCGQGSGGNKEICGCMKFYTKPSQAQTDGSSNFVDVTVAPSLSASADIPSTEVRGITKPESVSSNLSGQGRADVNVSSVAGSSISIPSIKVSGRTSGASVPVNTTGTNINSVSLSGNVMIGKIPVEGLANTSGIPVVGSIDINTVITKSPISFTGTVGCVNGNILVLREQGTNREISISLNDISKIKFANFQGMQCMSRVLQQNRLDRNSCAYGIERSLRIDKNKPGRISIYGSSTNNPLDELIDTREILAVDGGVLWTAKKQDCNCAMHTVYSIYNIAGYAFLAQSCGAPSRESFEESWEF